MGYNSNRTGASVVASLGKANSSVQSVKINGQTKTPDASGVVDLGNIEGGGSNNAYIFNPEGVASEEYAGLQDAVNSGKTVVIWVENEGVSPIVCTAVVDFLGENTIYVTYSAAQIVNDEGNVSHVAYNVSQSTIELVAAMPAPIISSFKTINGESIIGDGNITIEGGGSTSAYIEIPMEDAAATINAGNVYWWPLDNSTQARTITLNGADAGSVYKVVLIVAPNKPESITITPPQGMLMWEEGLQPDYTAQSSYEIEVRCIIANALYIARYTEMTGFQQNRGTFINFSVLDWNIKTSAGIQEHAWSSRRNNVLGFMFGQIADDNGYTAPAPDIIGLQEIYQYGTQWSDIESYINGKTFYGKTYAGIIAYRGDTVLLDSEGDAILYNTQMFELVDSGHFWLRGGDGWPEDPFTEGIASWEASTADNRIYKRIAIWAILRHKASGKEVFVLNTHYNPSKAGSLTMQYYSTVLVKKLVNQLNGGRPTILMGDLNCNPDTSPIKLFLPTYDLFGNAMDDARLLFGEKYTVNDWNTADNSLAIFDYILTKGDGFKVNAFTVGGPRTSENGYLSDHNALISDIYLNLY